MKKVSNPALQVSLTAPLALRSMLHTRICNFLCVHSSHHHLQYAISFRYLSSVIPPDLQGCTRHSCFTRIKLFLGKGKKTSKYQTGGPYSPPSLSTSLLVALGRRSSAQANGSMHILCYLTPDPDSSRTECWGMLQAVHTEPVIPLNVLYAFYCGLFNIMMHLQSGVPVFFLYNLQWFPEWLHKGCTLLL